MNYIKNSKHIVNEDCRIYYWFKHNSKKSSDTIVFFPGSGLNHSAMINLEKLLYGKGFSTLLFDQRGTGFSSKPLKMKDNKIKNFSKDLELILEKEDIKNPIFVTHSFGFMPVVDYVSQTKNAKKIISFCGSPNFSKTIFSRTAYYTFQFLLRHKFLFHAYFNELKSKFKKREISYTDLSDLKGKNEKYFIDTCSKTVSLDYTRSNRSMAYANLHSDVYEQLKKINVPIVNILAKKDIVVTKTANTLLKRYCLNFKGLRVDGSHGFIMFNPESAFELILNNL